MEIELPKLAPGIVFGEGKLKEQVYDMVLHCIEKPLLECVMDYAKGNQSKAAEILGLNRNTLRKKLQQHDIK